VSRIDGRGGASRPTVRPHRAARAAVLALSLGLLAGCNKDPAPAIDPLAVPPGPSKSEAPPWFTDVTSGSGLDFTYRNGEEADHYSILESLGGGVALLDYDADGLLDVFITGGGYFDGPDKKQIKGHPNRLYKNLGQWKFQDVTAAVGLDRPVFYTNGCAAADYDSDGWPDLLVTGYGRLVLYRNLKGERFEDVTDAAGLTDRRPNHWSTSVAWGDVNADGHPDLFVCQYVEWNFQEHRTCKGGSGPHQVDVCGPNWFKSRPQQLYLNSGNGTFRDASAGLKPGKGLGVLIVDVDGDRQSDMYVVHDGMEKHLYLNKGGGKFEEVGGVRAAALNEFGAGTGSMGVDAADYDGSGHFSLFVTNFQQQPHDLYRNRGGGWFQHASRRAGITAIGQDFVGFGTGFTDFDRDGNEDLFVSNGHVLRYPPPPISLAQRPVLLRNDRRPGQRPADVRFLDVSAEAGPYFRGKHRGRAAAFGDLDNDGATDVVLNNCQEPVVLLRNTYPSAGHWLGVKLVGKPDRDAVGALLTLEVGGRKLVRAVKGGGSYQASNDMRVVFGLGEAISVDKLTVRWPSGQTQTWEGSALGADRYVILTQGEAGVRP
jgi:hypothetical protein